MAQTETTCLLLDGHQGIGAHDGWRVAQLQNLQTTAEDLRLTPSPRPPVPLKDAQGTFGGLENPTGVAVDVTGIIYVADSSKHQIYKIEHHSGEQCETTTTYLPCLGGLGRAPRQLNEPHGLTISAMNDLYVADTKNNRIQVFALHGLVLRKIWGRRDGRAGTRAGEFDHPWDVAADSAGNIYIADKGNHRVQKFDSRTRKFVLLDGTVLAAHVFQVLYGPRTGARFVFVPARQRLERWLAALGHEPAAIDEVTILSEEVASTRAARTLVLKTIDAVGADDILVEWNIVYPPPLATYPQPEPPFESPTRLAVDTAGRLYVVDENKDYVKLLDSEGRVIDRVTFVADLQGHFKPKAVTIDAEGQLVLTSSAGIHEFRVDEECCSYCRCVSHYPDCADITMHSNGCLIVCAEQGSVAELPPPEGYERQGNYLSRPLDSGIYQCQWHKVVLDFGTLPIGTSMTVSTYTSEEEQTAEEIASLQDDDWQTKQTNARNFLIQNGLGRFLWLKMEIIGNGNNTPILQHIQVYFPRQSYLQYLPAIYQADPVSKHFLERFLSIFETILSSIEEKVDIISQYFDPDGVPEPFLSWLASWVDMTFDPNWSVATRRQLLRHAAELYRQRGTPAGLKKLLLLAFDVQVQILEQFQLRNWLFLSGQATLGNNSVLWGDCVVDRLQLAGNSRIGDFALVETGNPLHDPFQITAHTFSIFIPAVYCRSEGVERRIRALIDQEKPAYTQYTLQKVEPRFRVGMQSTLGLDTIVGAYPRLILGECATLGYDTLLCCSHEDQGPVLPQVGEMRVGVSVVLR